MGHRLLKGPCWACRVLLGFTDRVLLGMQGVYKQMVEAFRSLGVEAVPGPGNIFDPEVHEAIMREENDDLPDGTVLQEFRRGFKLGNQLLRAAMVQVRSLVPTMDAPIAIQ